MTAPHFATGRTKPVRCLVIHCTDGAAPGDFEWLRKGGSKAYPVSAHYYIAKNGEISQFVNEEDTAWHAGASRWVIDGNSESGLNKWSIGIELSNFWRRGEAYTAAQVEAVIELSRGIVARHDIPRSQLVRHSDISGKTVRKDPKYDPGDRFPWLHFTSQVYGDAPMNRVIGTRPTIALARFLELLARREAPFGEHLETIGTRIYALCDWLDIDPAFWLAVWTHEQGVPLGKSEIGQATRNPFNIKAYGRTDKVRIRNVDWERFESWQIGAFQSVLHLKRLYGERGLLDVETIIPIFAPTGDGNAPDRYIAAVIADMRAMQTR